MEPVRNHRNKIVVDAARLHRAKARREHGETLIEGPDLIADAIAAGVTPRVVFALPDRAPEGALHVDDRALSRLAGTKSPRGPVAVVDIPRGKAIGDRDVVVAVGVSDPGNLGALIRTAAAFGMAFAYTPGTADPWSPKALRAGAGGQFQTPVVQIEHPSDTGCTLVATVVAGGRSTDEVDSDRIAILVGDEASGLDEDIVRASDVKVTIPTPGPTESLNVAVAAGIVIHQLANRKGKADGGV